MLPRFVCKHFRQLKKHLLSGSWNIVKSQENILFQRPILLHQNDAAHFSSYRPATTKTFEKPFNKVASNTEAEDEQPARDEHPERDKNHARDEQMFLRSLNDPDTFGSSSDDVHFNESVEAGDIAKEKFTENTVSKTKRLSTKQYAQGTFNDSVKTES